LEQLDFPYAAAPIPLLPIWQARTTTDGLLSIAGPALFTGTVADGIFTPRVSDWHVTSDLVRLENRALTPLGRADSRVKVLGELVDTALIETRLLALAEGRIHPDSLAVVAIPDERAEHVLVPVFEGGVDAAAVESTLARYQEQASGLLRLQAALVVERFPRSELGKLRRSELVRQCIAIRDFR
ncbi:MAG: hypothetical protein V4640_02720, partial [Verrucomicrobiota bacterium]